ncbi:MAG TPA: hypothetical protein DCS07_01195 [Bdellovibrionales bacterium]|nr:MAG: hypothetical protein A2Z97_01460 [Bdellovibrionales bacterium GWB1_52_6]OFZ05000.1 MAG: hypothetical protein A2X97_00170 [Bdellovibrionales bacterium GWA1_52_35]HAR41242.1 hypothetical protein [Bdellovibrionales bacterium]HCM41230.1 hypothetical protein [Bdellovibrionales bacterium]
MNLHPELLSTADDIEKLAESLKGHDVIAFDTEFIREQTFYPIIEIIQVATDDDSWLVDAKAFKKNFSAGPKGGYDSGIDPLLEIFQDPSILKILHAAQGDQECLYTSFGMVASPALDTAIAASLCGYGDGIGLGKLLKSVLDVTIKKGHARTNWAMRPIPEQLKEYAHADVQHLVRMGRQLLLELEKLGRREWGLELSSKWSEAAVFDVEAEVLATKLGRGAHLDRKAQAALYGLVKWREERVRQLNLPRRWVADDAVLIDLARVRPKDLAHMSAFRGLNKGELKNSGEQLLTIIRASSERSETVELERTQRQASPSTEEGQVIDLVRCYLGILADRHKIAAKHLGTVGQMLPLLRQEIENPVDLVKYGVLSEHAAQLIGAELIAFMQGKKALSIRAGEVEIVGI